MKLIINRQALIKALNFTGQAIPAKSAEVQFLNYLLDVKENELVVTSSNGQISTRYIQPKTENNKQIIDAIELGSVQVEAKALLPVCSAYSGEKITLETIDNLLVISTDDGESIINLLTRDGKDYPGVDLDIDTTDTSFTLDGKTFSKLLDSTYFSVATKSEKECLTGINIKVADNKLSFSASDATRLSIYQIDVKGIKDFSFTCPLVVLKMVQHSLEDSDSLQVYVEDRRALFVMKNSLISTSLYTGEYPTIDKLVPNDFIYRLVLSKDEYIKKINPIKVLNQLSGEIARVKMTVSKDNAVTLDYVTATKGNGQMQLATKDLFMPMDQDCVMVCYNLNYVLDAINSFTGNEFTFEFKSPTALFRLVDSDDFNNIQVIAPVRMA